MPKILRKYLVNWYHTYLSHPGMDITEATISQHYYWPQLRDNIRTHINVCNTCQKKMKQNFKYGKLSAKEAEAIPWDRLSVDLIGPCVIKKEGHDDPLMLKAVTTIETETGWLEIAQYNEKQAATI